MRHFTRIVIALAGLLSGIVAGAQYQAHFDRIGMEQGLPGRQVLCLFQDRDGLIWIGTDNGLARHEGARIRTWHHDRKDPQSLSNEQVNAIAEAADGTMWVGTANGVSRMDRGALGFVRYTLPARDAEITGANRVRDVLPDVNGRTWISTELGLFSLDPSTGEAERVRIASGPWAFGEGPEVLQRSLLRDTTRQGIWVGTTLGLAFHHLPSGAWYHAANDPLGWGCFTTAGAAIPLLRHDGTLLWFDVDHYALMVVDMRGGLRSIEHLNGERMRFTPRLLAQDADGSFWLSTWTYRLFKLAPDLESAVEIPDDRVVPGAMVEGGPYCTLLDRWGTRWFGTREGVALLAPWRQHIHVMHPRPGMPLLGVLAQLGDTLLLSTKGQGLLIQHRPSGSDHLLSLPDPGPLGDSGLLPFHIQSMVQLTGRVYLLATSRGLMVADLDQLTLRPASDRMELPLELMVKSITCLARDGKGHIWIGTWSQGLYRLHPDGTLVRFQHRATDPTHSLPMNGILDLLVARNGDVWVGLNDGGGLVRLPGGEGPADTHFQATGTDALYAVVTSLAEAADGTLWAGTHQGGVNALDPATGAIRTYTRSDGLPSDRIRRLAIDARGRLWAITTAGPAYLPQGTQRFVPLNPPDGMAAGDFVAMQALLANGDLALVNNELVLLIGTAERPAERPVPEVIVVRAQHPGGELFMPTSKGTLQLPFNRRAMALEAAALGDAAVGRIQFNYFVEGISAEPLPIGGDGRLELIDLPRGQHRIAIRASSDGQHWSITPAVFTVEVLPPFWATWWFRVALLLLIAAIVWIMVRTYVRDRLEKQRIAFEKEQALLAERMRIASDMHDDLGGGLTALKLHSDMALRTENDPSKRRHLEHLSASAGDLIASMRQIIWTMDEEQRGLADLVAYCSNFARRYLSEHGLGCAVEADGPWPPIQLGSEQRRSILLVIKEALHNVVKHAQASNVRLSMRMDGGALVVKITDDGQGMNGAHSGGNGLRNMRRRLDLLGGELVIAAAPDQGTRVEMRAPLDRHT